MESPLALSVDGAHKLVEKAKNKGVRLGVAFQSRFHPALAALQKIIAGGELGEIELIEITLAEPVKLAETWWADSLRSGPAALFRLGVHALDLAVWLKGRAASEVTAMGDEVDRGLNTFASVLMRFSDGSFASATGTTRLPEARSRVHVEGSQGSARVVGDLSGGGAVLVQSRSGNEREQRFGPANPAQIMLTAFTESIGSQTDFLPDGGDGQRLVEITCAVIEAMKARRAVKVGEIARLT
jgi:predicted dehydrogenase